MAARTCSWRIRRDTRRRSGRRSSSCASESGAGERAEVVVTLADWWVAPAMTGLALVALSLPFYRGLRVCLEARAATRRMDMGELRRRVESPGAPGEPLSVLMLRTLVDSLRQRGDHPREFIVDAT